MSIQNFYGIPRIKLEDFFRTQGKERFRSQQMYRWVHAQGVTDPQLMTNLSKEFRAEIPEIFSFDLPKVTTHLVSVDGTQKFLFEFDDKLSAEAVLIPSQDRMTLCISSEVGCNMACKFCFTGKQKLKRRLTSAEIVGQFLQARALSKLQITNIVFMGMGEPLDNCENVFGAIEVLVDDFGINFSRKKITVSTSGIVPEMHRVIDAKVRLAVSLNGSNDKIRSEVMPINNRWPLKELLAACLEYTRATKDKVTFEYVLLKGVTDSVEQAHELYQLTRKVPCKLNIIPFNEHPGSGYERPLDSQIAKFHKTLMDLGAHVLLRRTMGRDIYAACGQLTSEFEGKPTQMDISNSKIGGPTKKPRVEPANTNSVPTY